MQQHKSIPAKHIYDARGSELFERICELDEYYLTRTETSIIENDMADIVDAIGPGATLIEPGAGSGEKAARLLSAMEEPQLYVPIEISESALQGAIELIESRCPDIGTQPICGDFTCTATLRINDDGQRVVYFPGSTIGNFDRSDRVKLWQQFADMAGERGRVLVGFDLIKSTDILLPAYNDSEGVTEAFNTNLLHRIKNELAGELDIDGFTYECRWNADLQCVEMGQRSITAQTIRVAGKAFELAKDEIIRTERSHKFTLEKMDAEAAEAGFVRETEWMDRRAWFCVGLFNRT